MDYPSALEKLYSLSPRGIRLGLDRVRVASKELGCPERDLRCVQVAGTNGKGTVAAEVAQAARASGVKAGLYTSPHLHRFTERIQIDGAEVETGELGRHLGNILELTEKIPDLALTFFEIATLAAFKVFAENQVELAVLEVGLGGRLDATSIVEPEVSAITSIGLDHTDLLGNTLTDIAREKAAIARPGVPLVTGALPKEALAVVQETAAKLNTPLFILNNDFSIPDSLTPPWPGAHQKQNAAVALKIFELLGQSDKRLERQAFIDALPKTRWPGRFEILEGRPKFILDGAHNTEAIEALVQSLNETETSQKPQVMIFGALKDKEGAQNLDLLRSKVGHIILVPPPIPRALDPQTYAKPEDHISKNTKQALELARTLAQDSDTILVTGSLFTVAALRALLLDESTDPPIGL